MKLLQPGSNSKLTKFVRPDLVQSKSSAHRILCLAEVAGVTFLESDSAPVSKFWNPCPAIFQIWESDSCQTPVAIINPTLIHPCFSSRNNPTDSCYCRNLKVTPDPGPIFPKFLTPGPEEKLRILPESTPVFRTGPTSAVWQG